MGSLKQWGNQRKDPLAIEEERNSQRRGVHVRYDEKDGLKAGKERVSRELSAGAPKKKSI